jgi:F-type H+-transporting ATPase subunit delta
MLDSIISERYAKALFELSLESGKLETVKRDMDLLVEVAEGSREFRHLLVNPVIRPDKKYGVLAEIFKANSDPLTLQFFRLICGKRREMHLEGIAREFIAKYKEHHNILTIEITTVSPLGDDLRNKIITLIEKRQGVTVDLVETIDPKLLGGFVVQTENKRYDSSLANSIKKLRKEFEENLYIREF